MERADLKEAVLEALERLPWERQAEVLEFALSLLEHERYGEKRFRPVVKAVPASHLNDLVGLVSWGGDAVEDAERLYE